MSKLTYWDKQLILYSKGHYGNEHPQLTLEFIVGKMCSIEWCYATQSTVFHRVIDVYTTLVEQGKLSFDLSQFINNSFGIKNQMTVKDVIRHTLSELQNVDLDDQVNIDQPLLNEIKNFIAKEGNDFD